MHGDETVGFIRCLGSVGVARGAVRDITDSTNESKAYSFMSISWGLGGVIGREFQLLLLSTFLCLHVSPTAMFVTGVQPLSMAN